MIALPRIHTRRAAAAVGAAVLLPLSLVACGGIEEPSIDDSASLEPLDPVTITETVVDEADAEAEEEPVDDEPADEVPAEQAPVGESEDPIEVSCSAVAGDLEHDGRVLGECDGEWAYGYTPQSDDSVYYMLSGTHWVEIQPDGQTFTGFNCYDVDSYADADAPAFITDGMLECD